MVKNIYLLLFASLIILSCSTVAIGLLKSIVSPAFGLAKDIIVCFILICCIKNLKTKPSVFLVFFSYLLISLILILITQINNDQTIFQYLFNFKVYTFYFLVIFSILSVSSTEKAITPLYKIFFKIVWFFCLLNIILAFLQRFAFADLLQIIGINDIGSIRGVTHNIVIQTQDGILRVIGTFTTPMAMAEFMMFSLIFFTFFLKNNLKKHLFVILCLFAISFTSYKTTILYIPFALFLIYGPVRLWKISAVIYGSILFTFGLIATHSNTFYQLIYPYSPTFAEFSVRIRVLATEELYTQVENSGYHIFGAGYGRNGIMHGTDGFILDSFYLNIISNYGLPIFIILSAISFILVSLASLQKKPTFHQVLFHKLKLYLFVLFAANCFWNNPITNFPSLFIPLISFLIIYKVCLVEKKHFMVNAP